MELWLGTSMVLKVLRRPCFIHPCLFLTGFRPHETNDFLASAIVVPVSDRCAPRNVRRCIFPLPNPVAVPEPRVFNANESMSGHFRWQGAFKCIDHQTIEYKFAFFSHTTQECL